MRASDKIFGNKENLRKGDGFVHVHISFSSLLSMFFKLFFKIKWKFSKWLPNQVPVGIKVSLTVKQ